MPIELMPQNREPYRVLRYYLSSVSWVKNKEDGLYRAEYDPLKLGAVMERLQIDSREVFEKVSGCLFELVRLPQE